MSTRDWRKQLHEPTWPDVWTWCAEITKNYGLYIRVVLNPPLLPTKQPYGTISVEGYQMGPNGMQRLVRLSWKPIDGPSGVAAVRVALQMVSRLETELDNEKLRAERDADLQGRLF